MIYTITIKTKELVDVKELEKTFKNFKLLKLLIEVN